MADFTTDLQLRKYKHKGKPAFKSVGKVAGLVARCFDTGAKVFYYRKRHKGRMTGMSHRGSKVPFGDFAPQATECGWMTARQIEAGRFALTRHIKRGGKIWSRVVRDRPITKKPLEVRRGKGKGSVEYWVAQIQPGKMLYEMEGVSEDVAREAFRRAAAKLPVSTRVVTRTVM